jgi:hypothetical protein
MDAANRSRLALAFVSVPKTHRGHILVTWTEVRGRNLGAARVLAERMPHRGRFPDTDVITVREFFRCSPP